MNPDSSHPNHVIVENDNSVHPVGDSPPENTPSPTSSSLTTSSVLASPSMATETFLRGGGNIGTVIDTSIGAARSQRDSHESGRVDDGTPHDDNARIEEAAAIADARGAAPPASGVSYPRVESSQVHTTTALPLNPPGPDRDIQPKAYDTTTGASTRRVEPSISVLVAEQASHGSTHSYEMRDFGTTQTHSGVGTAASDPSQLERNSLRVPASGTGVPPAAAAASSSRRGDNVSTTTAAAAAVTTNATATSAAAVLRPPSQSYTHPYLLYFAPLSKNIKLFLLFFFLGFLAEIYTYVVLFAALTRFVREVFWFSLARTGFSPATALFIIFFLPLFFTTCQFFRKHIWAKFILLHVLLAAAAYVLLWVSVVHNIYVRVIVCSISLFFALLWMDFRVSSHLAPVRVRTMFAFLFGIVITMGLHYANSSLNPFWSQWEWLFIFALIGLFALAIQVIELFLIFWNANHLEEICRRVDNARSRFLLSPNEHYRDSKTGRMRKRSSPLNILLSVISLIFWALGFASVFALVYRFFLVPAIMTSWARIDIEYGILIPLAFCLGIFLSFIRITQTPLFIVLVALPAFLCFHVIEQQDLCFAFGLLFAISWPIVIRFFLEELSFTPSGMWSGHIGVTQVFFVMVAFSEMGTINSSHYLPLFGHIFFQREWLLMIVQIIFILLSLAVVLVVNRLHYFTRTYGILPPLSQRLIYVFLTPHWAPHDGDLEVAGADSSTSAAESNAATIRRRRFFQQQGVNPDSSTDLAAGAAMPRLRLALKTFAWRLLDVEHLFSWIVFGLGFVLLLILLPSFLLFALQRQVVASHDGQSSFRLATYNVYQGFTLHGLNNAYDVSDLIEDNFISLVGLQEIVTTRPSNAYFSLIDVLAERTDMMPFSSSVRDQTLGCGFLSSREYLSHSIETLPEASGDVLKRVACRAEFNFGVNASSVIPIYTVHVELDTGGATALEQVNRLVQLTSDEPTTIVMGDFNAEASSSVIQRMRQAGFYSAYEFLGKARPVTYRDIDGAERSIDWIFFRGNIRAVNVFRIETDISDHFPVIADFVPSERSFFNSAASSSPVSL